jgi:acyl-CoA thioester hydrolase
MADTFSVSLRARGYEADSNGHVAGSVLLEYAQHARWECLRAAGIEHAELHALGIGPVDLEEVIRFHHEVLPGQEVEVSCCFEWGRRKTFRVRQELRGPDGTIAAEVANTGGLLDLVKRRLLPNPSETLRSLADTPDLLGL